MENQLAEVMTGYDCQERNQQKTKLTHPHVEKLLRRVPSSGSLPSFTMMLEQSPTPVPDSPLFCGTRFSKHYFKSIITVHTRCQVKCSPR